MKRRRMKGFTLIELIAVLVILAILALIVTPLVMNIVKKAKDSANKRSVDAYGKAVELAVATYLLDNGDYPSSLDNLTVEYSGSEVTCLTKTLNNDGSIYLSGCSVKNTEVLDSNNADGYYHFGRTTLSSNQELIYDTYAVGDEVTYNNIDFYVIEDSDENSDSVKLLKAEPLTVEEVELYGEGHININTEYRLGQVTNENGYGGIVYYSSESCGAGHKYPWGEYDPSGCSTNYEDSDIKYTVNGWSNDKLNISDLKESSRLITFDEVVDNLGYVYHSDGNTAMNWYPSEDTPSFVYNSNYYYWTMSSVDDSTVSVYVISQNGIIDKNFVCSGMQISNRDYYSVVRPVVTLYKSALQ